jgi:hypothetical protein
MIIEILIFLHSGDSDVLNLASSLASDLAQLVETMNLRSETRQNKNNTTSSGTPTSASTTTTDSRRSTLVIKLSEQALIRLLN